MKPKKLMVASVVEGLSWNRAALAPARGKVGPLLPVPWRALSFDQCCVEVPVFIDCGIAEVRQETAVRRTGRAQGRSAGVE